MHPPSYLGVSVALLGHPKARATILAIWTPVTPPSHLGVYGPSLRHITHVHPPSHLEVSVALLGHPKTRATILAIWTPVDPS